MKLRRVIHSAITGGRCVAFDGCSVHFDRDARIASNHVWVRGQTRAVSDDTLAALEGYALAAIAYEVMTGSVEGFPEQEFDL